MWPGSFVWVVTEYTYYPGVDQPHSLKRGSSIHYYATDYPGNMVGLVGSQHEMAKEYRYSPCRTEASERRADGRLCTTITSL